MKDWEEFYLGEVGELNRGKSKHRPRWAPQLFGGDYPFIQTGEITAAEKYISKYSKTYSEAGLEQSKLWEKGTLCITIAANIAEIAILDIAACFPDSILGFTPNKEKVDLDFVYYTLLHFQKRLKRMAIGSVQDNINLGTFKKIKFPFPKLEEQREVSKILAVLDDKILLLRKQNETIEQIAQTLYKRWFGDFEFPNERGEPYKSSGGKMMLDGEFETIPEGWETSLLGELAENKANSYKFTNADVVFINTGDVFNGNFLHKNYSNPIGLPGQAKKAIQLYDILYSEIRPKNKRFAFVDFDADDYVVSTKFMVVKTKGEIYSQILYLILKNEKTIHAINQIAESRSGTFPQVTFGSISNFPIIKPPMVVQDKFMNVLNPIMLRQKLIGKEIETLISLRDTLLPKLMKREIKMSVKNTN